jgi:hypothetical protein
MLAIIAIAAFIGETCSESTGAGRGSLTAGVAFFWAAAASAVAYSVMDTP